METKANYVLIGAFTIAGFLGLLLFLMWFAKLEVDQQFDYYDIYFPEVSGLGVSSNVSYAGLTVGKVVDMQLSEDTNAAVRVRIEVEQGTPVRTDSSASLELQGVTGIANVAITSGSPEAPLLSVASEEPVPAITASRSALQTLSDQGPEMIERLNTVAGQLNELLGEGNQTRVRNILDNVERSSGNIDKALADVSKATDAIGVAAEGIAAFGAKLDGLSAAAETTLSNADVALAKFTETAGNADTTLASASAALDEARGYFAGDLKTLTQSLEETSDSVRADVNRLTTRADTTMTGLDETLDIGKRTLAAAERTFEGADKVINSNIEPVVADLRVTLGKANEAIERVISDLPEITDRLRNAADSADSAFTSLRVMLDSARSPVQAFAREGLPQFTRLAADLRNVSQNVNELISALRRNPSQILSGQKTPEFRR
ncbi:phospholipid/cholesterol/gamma-HCH transport system substrate-binding protein [Paracoccus halophilus]|uniref:Phospholipid/cholesterol/gamma-HCH transport system substrate-binding protein n=1 Tax=Paracoccus halophilus TaxID=376733 RepID=A0A099F5Q2_9RHOB|nr:MlaD family protein [Paracoccus halophilus]KGJ05598.1 hypothetical protein IT41_05140 [Paracoccus halophilus]SFA47304.1 phospholipid/cholesterol/gamma-HCH transport system substrate-binding protein [Paracoccus halophilus]